jgi:hypothetical protein
LGSDITGNISGNRIGGFQLRYFESDQEEF